MPQLKPQIVLVYDRSADRFGDKSDTVESLRRESTGIFIKYKNSDREYKYGPKNVLALTLKESPDPAVHDIFIDGELQSGITAIGDYGSHYAVIRKGSRSSEYIAAAQVAVKRSAGKSILGYLTEVAAQIKDEEPEDDNGAGAEKKSFLSSQIGKIIQSDDSVLAAYLNKASIQTNTTPETLIYPLDVNTSQKEAIKKALTHNISIIQGPPGTGKTQSILNLVANLVGQGKSVGIVSNNNSAIENVKHKLEKAGYGFLIAHLGNNENNKRFFEAGSHDYEPDSAWRQDSKAIKSCTKKLNRIDAQIDRLLQAKEELAKCKELLPRLKHERDLLHSTFDVAELAGRYTAFHKWDSEKLAAFKTVLSYFPERTPISKLFLSFSLSLKYGRLFTLARRLRGADLSLALDALIYDKKTAETESRIRELEKILEKNDLTALLRTCSELSAVLFKNALYERYSRQKEPDFTADNYQNRFSEFAERFPVILSTTHSILNSVPNPLDYIIIDESSQVDIITASLAFSACRNAVIVGDEQQLPHIVTDAVKEKAAILRERFDVPPEYNYVEKNAITSLTALYGDTIPKTLLREHYRCNPLIIGFCNRKYYQGQLIVMKDEPADGYNENNFPVRIFRTVEGLHGHNKINERQKAVIEHEILPGYTDVPQDEIGIITPYRNQANLLTKTGIESDTIHKFQGREKRKIIFSTVSNEITEFMDKAELINVAVSRAIDQFVMVMPHAYELTHGSNVGDLIRYIEHWNPYGSVESSVVSCFDLLQSADSARFDDFKKRIKGTSRFESENIIEEVIRGILNESPAYSGFYIRRGYPLYLLTPNKTGLTDREIAYSNHRLSHVDFLIINRCDNSFVLAIEVDGYTYHTQVQQQERDAIKNKVLTLNGIELLRLSTRGYLEPDKIKEKLQKITLPPSA